MSLIVSTFSQGTLGLQPRSVIVKARNVETATTIVTGDLVRFDLTQPSSFPGNGSALPTAASNSKFANVKVGPFTGTDAGGIYGVAQEDIRAGQIGYIMVVGVTNVKCSSLTYVAGEIVGTSSDAATVTNSNPVAKVGTVLSSSGSAVTSIQIMLDGSLTLA
jgi:hypothetical protein